MPYIEIADDVSIGDICKLVQENKHLIKSFGLEKKTTITIPSLLLTDIENCCIRNNLSLDDFFITCSIEYFRRCLTEEERKAVWRIK